MKLFIFKVLTIFLSFTLLGTENNFFSDFENEVINGYDKYYEIIDEGNITDSFELKIFEGINKGQASYAIAFKSSKDYRLLIEIDEQLYELPKNEEGYYYGYAIKSTSIMFLEIIDSKGNDVPFDGTIKLNKIHISNDDLKYNNGNNKGLEFTNLVTFKYTIPFFSIVVICSLSLIFVCALGILILFIRRRGMFNKNVRAQGILNLEDLISEAKKKTEENLWDGYTEVIAEEIDEEENVQENTVDELFDLEVYLLDKGYLLDYSLLSEEEKNNLMVELMMLKNSNKISEDTYYEETYKLWKK